MFDRLTFGRHFAGRIVWVTGEDMLIARAIGIARLDEAIAASHN